MKNFIYFIIIVVILSVVPIIPYENTRQSGVTTIESKTVLSWVWEKYQITEERQKQRKTEVKVEAPVAQ